MDIQRYLLIAAAVALSFMLLTEWTAFKDQRTAQERSDRRASTEIADFGGPTSNPIARDTASAQTTNQSADLCLSLFRDRESRVDSGSTVFPATLRSLSLQQ